MNKLTKNVIISIFAQAISFATSFVLGFIVPKFIDELQYVYWQTFVLYVTYASVFTFGILEGIILRYAQYDYDQLNKPRLKSQFELLIFINFAICIIASLIIYFTINSVYKWVYILVFVSCLIRNAFLYISYVYQCTNRIKEYALYIILQRGAYAVIVIVLLLCGVNNFIWYCLAEIFSNLLAFLMGLYPNKEIFTSKRISFVEFRGETRANISSGILLLIANLSNGLLVGGAKMITQWRWDELIFGKVSFGFSVWSSVFLFIIAISIVLFPSLKRLNEQDLPEIYKRTRNAVSPILQAVLILYFPICFILSKWLPNYTESLVFLGTIMPLIVFDSKVSLLTNNYLKIFNKEKHLFFINLVAVIICFGLCALSAFVLNSLDLVIYSLVFVSIIRSIVSEIFVFKLIKKSFYLDFFAEILLSIAFICSVKYLSLWWGCLAYFIALLIYGVVYRKNVKSLFQNLKGHKKPVKMINEEKESEENVAN